MTAKTVFVTVGTTSFTSLIDTVVEDEFIQKLVELGFGRLVVQYGRGTEPRKPRGIDFQSYTYKPSLNPDIIAADLVISHCGAGTCLEVLEAQRPLVVVVNEELADNHQVELAKRLQESGHLAYATCKEVESAVQQVARSQTEPYIKGDAKIFVGWLDKFMGLTKSD